MAISLSIGDIAETADGAKGVVFGLRISADGVYARIGSTDADWSFVGQLPAANPEIPPAPPPEPTPAPSAPSPASPDPQSAAAPQAALAAPASAS